MVGWRYTGPFDELPAWQRAGAEHRVIAWDEVSADEGTGIVHIAPGCGREDFALSKEHRGLPVLAPLDESGVYVDGFGWLTGQHVADVARADLREPDARRAASTRPSPTRTSTRTAGAARPS